MVCPDRRLLFNRPGCVVSRGAHKLEARWMNTGDRTPARATELQGSWTATKAEREGHAVDDIVRHQLSFTGNAFRIQSKDGKLLHAGTIHADRTVKPAAIDFIHEDGALKGKVWKGIY